MKSYVDVIDETDLESKVAIEGVLQEMTETVRSEECTVEDFNNVIDGLEYLHGTAAISLLEDEEEQEILFEYADHLTELCVDKQKTNDQFAELDFETLQRVQ